MAPWPMNPIGNSTDVPTPGVVFLRRCPGLRRARLRDSGPGRHAESAEFDFCRRVNWKQFNIGEVCQPKISLRLHVEK